jgi:hypothetical protein
MSLIISRPSTADEGISSLGGKSEGRGLRGGAAASEAPCLLPSSGADNDGCRHPTRTLSVKLGCISLGLPCSTAANTAMAGVGSPVGRLRRVKAESLHRMTNRYTCTAAPHGRQHNSRPPRTMVRPQLPLHSQQRTTIKYSTALAAPRAAADNNGVKQAGLSDTASRLACTRRAVRRWKAEHTHVHVGGQRD